VVTYVVTVRTKNHRLVHDALIDNAWLADVANNPTVEGSIQCVRLWEDIEEVVRDEERRINSHGLERDLGPIRPETLIQSYVLEARCSGCTYLYGGRTRP
jgi:hypothetical protein